MSNFKAILESPHLQYYYALPTNLNGLIAFPELAKLLPHVYENMIIVMYPIDSEPQLLIYNHNRCLEYVSYIDDNHCLEKRYEFIEVNRFNLTASYKILGHWTGEIH